jgi:3-methyladenine DNA glycosylase AlkD
METVENILSELQKMGTASIRNVFLNHGAPASTLGVKVGDMKTIVKRVKKNHELAIGLYATGISDAMYLAGLIGDETKMTKADLNRWAKESTWHMISEYAVPFVAAESPLGWQLACSWIESRQEHIAAAGWATLSGIVSIMPDSELDLDQLKKWLLDIPKLIHSSPNRVRYTMNNFVIAVGCYVVSLTEQALKTASKIADVEVDMGKTSCKLPMAVEYINKVAEKGKLGKKKKTARC